jgi:hypothetical protein
MKKPMAIKTETGLVKKHKDFVPIVFKAKADFSRKFPMMAIAAALTRWSKRHPWLPSPGTIGRSATVIERMFFG